MLHGYARKAKFEDTPINFESISVSFTDYYRKMLNKLQNQKSSKKKRLSSSADESLEFSLTNKSRKNNNIKQTKNEKKTADSHIEKVMENINTDEIIETSTDIFNLDPSFKGVMS